MFKINRSWSSPKSMLSVDAKLEEKEATQGGKKFWSEAIFFKINHYQEQKEITMLFTAHDLRALVFALEDLHATGESKFKNYTQKAGAKNTLTLGGDKGTYFINIERVESGNTIKVAHLFGSYSIRAFAQTLSLMADETEKALFAAQSGFGV